MLETERPTSGATPPRFALSIVIPVYNGAGSIAELVRAIEKLSIDGGHEIVLVDDGSPDGSLEICKELVGSARVPITLVSLARNYGEHNAVLAGLRHVSGAHVITMDDDLQNPPEEIERLLAHAQRSAKQVIYTYYDEKQHSVWRNLGSRFTDRVADFVLEKPQGLYLSSFRCMSAFVVREVSRYEGPFPYIDGLILQVTHDIDRLRVAPTARRRPQQLYAAAAHAALDEHVCQFFGDAPADQHDRRIRLQRRRRDWRRDGYRRGLALLTACRLGLADGGGAAARGRTARDPRHHRRVSWAALPDRQRQTSVGRQRGAPQPPAALRRAAADGVVAGACLNTMMAYSASLMAAILSGSPGKLH